MESSPTLEEYLRGEGRITAEEAGVNRDDYENDYEYWEDLSEMGVSEEDPLEWMQHRDYGYSVPHFFSQFHRQAKRMPLADEIRANLQGDGPKWAEGYAAAAREPMLDILQERKDAGKESVSVGTAASEASGLGPMIDVNPVFRGMGLGRSMLASILENTGRVQESYSSPAGYHTLQSLAREMGEQNIPHDLYIDEKAKTPIDTQNLDWRSGEALHPHQGTQQLWIPEGTTLLPKQPEKTVVLPANLEMLMSGKQPRSREQMERLLEDTSRSLYRLQDAPPPSVMNEGVFAPPFSDPAWLYDLDWGQFG